MATRVGDVTGGDVVRRQQSVGRMKTRVRATLPDAPASAGSGAKERRAAPLSLACPKTLLCRFTRASLRASDSGSPLTRAVTTGLKPTRVSDSQSKRPISHRLGMVSNAGSISGGRRSPGMHASMSMSMSIAMHVRINMKSGTIKMMTVHPWRCNLLACFNRGSRPGQRT